MSTPISIKFTTPTGRHVMACKTCGHPVGVRVSKPLRDSKGQYRKVDSVTCRKCTHSHHYIVRPHTMTREEMAAFSAARKAARICPACKKSYADCSCNVA
jgi:hypothetical protein